MKLLFFFILLPTLASCNQVTLGAGSAVKNFFASPIKGVQSLFTEASYEKEREDTLNQRKEKKGKDLTYCIDQSGRPIDDTGLSDLDKLRKKIRTTACSCSPWGNCPTSVCSCDIQCPKGFDIFQHPSGMTPKKLSQDKNGLAFRNRRIPSRFKQTQGYCWGHARLTSQFNRLAFFKPGKKAPYNINSNSAQEQDKAVNYYKELIDKIDNNEAVDIPGFSDLKTLSDHPAMQSYLADKVAKSWASQAMSFQGLNIASGSSRKPNAYYTKFFKDVKERIDMNMQPTVVFTGRGSAFQTHAILVSHYETLSNGQIKLCLRDNNNPESHAATCRDNMTIDPKKGLIYSDPIWGEIGDISIAHNEKSDATAQADSLREKCQSEKGCR